MSLQLASANYQMFARYRDICTQHPEEGGETSTNHLAWMCQVAIENLTAYPLDKLSRWLGFIQGCLTCKGLIDVQTERDFSRPLFHRAYRAAGATVPPTLDRPA